MRNKLILSSLGHTWILDLDGTVVKHNGYKVDGYDTFLEGTAAFLKSLPDKDMVIFLTSRSEDYREQTEGFLKSQGVRYDYIIFGAPYGERILINDNKPSGLEMSKSICLNRDEGISFNVTIDSSL